MSFLNLGFEQAGAGPGEAHAWTLVVVAEGERLALFGGRDAEDFFVGWPTVEDYLFVLVPVLNTAEALFDTAQGAGESFEDFQEGWATNTQYEVSLSAVVDAFFSTTGPEDFSEGWGPYDFQLDAVVSAPLEDFAGLWNGGTAAGYSFVLGAVVVAAFDAGTQQVEDFFPRYVDNQVQGVDDNALRLVHGLEAGQAFTLRVGSNGQLPKGLLEGVVYYALSGTVDALRLARFPEGDQITGMEGTGEGVFYVQAEARTHWREAP